MPQPSCFMPLPSRCFIVLPLRCVMLLTPPCSMPLYPLPISRNTLARKETLSTGVNPRKGWTNQNCPRLKKKITGKTASKREEADRPCWPQIPKQPAGTDGAPFGGIVTTSPAVENKHWEEEETSMQSALNNQGITGRLPVADARGGWGGDPGDP